MDTHLVTRKFFKYVSFTTEQTFPQIWISRNAVTLLLRRRKVFYCLSWFLFSVENGSYLFGNSIFPSTEHDLMTHHFKRFGCIISLLCLRRLNEGTIKLCIGKVFKFAPKKGKQMFVVYPFKDLLLNVKITENNLCYFKMAAVLNN